MPYTDLSYYKLSVYLQVGPVWSGLVWPERLQARHRVLGPFFVTNCSIPYFQSFRKAALVL